MKSENGSITLFVLISMIFFLIISTTAYVSAMSKLQGQNAEVEQIKAAYEQDLSDESLLKLYNKATRTREWLQGSGTQEDTYKIYTIEDLVTFSIKSNDGDSFNSKYVELMNNLDFKQDHSYANANRTDFGDVNEDGTVQDIKTELTTGQGFKNIGTSQNLKFDGIFEGNKYVIKNLYINRDIYAIGLFGFNNGNIQNLDLENIYINSSKSTAGCAVGYNYGTIKNIRIQNGEICANRHVGGICGENWGGEITSCVNNAKVYYNTKNSGYGSYMGGICGDTNAPGTINKCINNGEITGEGSTGGITGGMHAGNITMCANTGKIIIKNNTSGAYVGGIAGFNAQNGQGNITNCYNTGEITVNENGTIANAGGIIGDIARNSNKASIKYCYNVGTFGSGVISSGIGFRFPADSVLEAEKNYWLTTCGATYGWKFLQNNNNAEAKTELEMKSQSFIDLLNLNNDDAPWEVDATNINNGYPILKWQLNNNN